MIARLIRKNKGKNITNVRNERGNTITDSINIKYNEGIL